MLSPETSSTKKSRIDPFYESLFQKLRRLLRFQLIVCPQSRIHQEESIVSADYDKLEEVYAFLSEGLRFQNPEAVRDAQVITIAKQRLGNKTDDWGLTRDFAITGEVNKWKDSWGFRLKAPVFPGYETAVRNIRTRRQKSYSAVHKAWARSRDITFAQRYRDERMGLGKAIRRRWSMILEHRILVEAGVKKMTDDDVWGVLEPEMSLLMELFTLFRRCAKEDEDPVEEVWRFLASDNLDAVPYIKISSLLFAALARRAVNPGKKPRSVPFADVDMIAAYLPFCDAMFVDREMHGLLEQKAIRRQLAFETRIFSLRTKSQFLDYLGFIEATASRQHMETVKDIYPSDID